MPRKTNQKIAHSKKSRKVSSSIATGVREEGASYEAQAPVFLTLAEVLKIHSNQIENYGGTDGVRDIALLESALAQPEAGFGGHWLHKDLYEMASAYAFHLCKNHPFLDGNKRTAFVSAMLFLETNGISIVAPQRKCIEVMLAVAEGKMSKKELAQIFRDLSKE